MRRPALAALALLTCLQPDATRAQAPDSFEALAAEYAGDVRAALGRYCLDCHSAEDAEGDLDLESLGSLDLVRKAPGTWRKVAEMLDSGEMPPKDSPQPEAAERTALRGWVARYLRAEAYADAGDPGPVTLRRLNNAQYAYTLRDLTGHDFRPARDFPADSAAGEGFTNTGDALVMSPALLGKYLDAGKRVAGHAVLLRDGFRFSAGETRRDWTEEILASIRALYAAQADSDGRIPLDRYLAAALESREKVAAGTETYEGVARARGLSPRLLAALAGVLAAGEPSPILDPLRARWKAATPADLSGIAADVAAWQRALTRMQPVGHMKPRVADVDPATTGQEVRFKLPDAGDAREVVAYLGAGGPAREGSNLVVWRNLRLAKPGRPDVALRDVRAIAEGLAARRAKVVESVARCLAAAGEAQATAGAADVLALAKKHDVDPEILRGWLDVLGVGASASARLDLFAGRMEDVGGHAFVKGWGSNETPLVVANASDETVHIPGELKGRGVAVHPSPTIRAGSAWACPADGRYTIEAKVRHAHPACGNGTTWRLELRRGAVRIALAEGVAVGGSPVPAGPFGPINLAAGSMVTLSVGPRDGNHACDLTAVDLTIKQDGEGGRAWDMAADVSGDALAANPHADSSGRADVWRFFREPEAGGDGLAIPAGSLLARWLETPDEAKRAEIAEGLRKLLADGPAGAAPADVALFRGLTTPGGPMVPARPDPGPVAADSPWGLDPAAFGPQQAAAGLAPTDLAVRSPSTIEVRIPAELATGAELVGTVEVRLLAGGDDFVQLHVGPTKPAIPPGLRPDAPVLVADAAAEARMKAAFAEFRRWFPPAFCYPKIVPVDEVVTLTLFHREDEALRRLVLDEAEAARLDRLWDDLHFVSRDALTQVDAFNQLMEYATQDSDPRLFEPYRVPIREHAEAFRKELAAVEPRQLDAVVEFASLAYRRPTTADEAKGLRDLYARLREEEIPHEDACRLILARILASPAFLYRLEVAPEGVRSASASDWELASRLSYFLRSSAPDAELREAATAGRLRDPDVMAAQAKRLLAAPDVRRLAEEFACQWLHIYDFDALDEKSEQHFPTFGGLKGAMYEEAVLFFADLFRADAPIPAIYDADHTFLNQALAEHYGIPGVTGPEWRRVDGVRKHGRGGILGLSATLAKQSGASRTSPILRGNWITEVLVGERVPKPPKDVPILPDEAEGASGLSVRQLTERHTKDEKCAGCHAKMDPYGYSLEAYDAVGRFRSQDAAGLPIDARARLADGTEFDGLDGLRSFLLTRRREAVERQFCKKLLGYALGRGVTLTDEPLLEEMQRRLDAEGHRLSTAVDAIVRSRQFREIRGSSPVVAEAR